MNSKIQLFSTENMTREEWLLFRKRGIGASEIGAVMGLDPFKSSIELFYEKIGEEIGYNIENLAMFMGKEQENFIAQLWEFWDGSVESMMFNYRNGTKVRRCRRINAYAVNPDYPWLFASLDRVINKHEGRDEGALELKTISGYASSRWEAGIPPSHVVQVQGQIKVCMMDYGELTTFTDGRNYDVVPFEHNTIITDNIIDATYEFWERVKLGRVLVNKKFQAQRSFNMQAVEEFTQELSTLEPPPDNSESYAEFIKARFGRSTEGERMGTILELEDAKASKRIKSEIKDLTEESRLHENRLKNAIGTMERLDFGGDGFVSWKSDVNGVRRLTNKVK